ncbi:hypothetical protein ACPX19_09585 [Winogradskyella sp. HB-48]|uniref:hypothetical protein n=1 Tax=Winogradskyella sp. HB-48 TaxID=3416808 RepID=UPI003CE858CA
MKNLKLALFSLAFSLLMVTSCTNNEPVGENPQQTEESQSISMALDQLRAKFNDSGNVNQSDNPTGNIVLDFCFDFVYPLTLSYNNGATVTVESLDGLIDIMLASTNELYINGIAFPFDVEVFNGDNNSIDIETIENEEEFVELLTSCEFDDFEACDCFEDFNPVCVEITDPNGGSFVVTYPNACYAECDGFTAEDFIEDCQDDYYAGGGFECFELNFPISVVTEDGNTITINSEEELGTALYGVYVFDFVYPFTVTLENETVVTINGPEDIEAILADCYGDYNGGGNDDCLECLDLPEDPVCVQYTTPTGETVIEVYPNACFAECFGFTAEDFVDCEEDNNPANCSEQELAAYLAQCEWNAVTSLNSNNQVLNFVFNSDGTVNASSDGASVSGTWQLASNPVSNEVFMFFVLSEPFGDISSLDWTVVSCSEEFIQLESTNEYLFLERNCE